MRNRGLVIPILLAALAAGSVLAEEVIYFTNGTVMPIRSHKVEGDTIHVDLGDNGYMAFPKSVVEKIEEAPDLVLMPSTNANKMFAGDSSTRVFGASPRQASTSWALPMQMDEQEQPGGTRTVGGVISAAPYASEDHPALQSLRVNNVPQRRGANPGSAAKPGEPHKFPNPAIKKKALVEFKGKD